MKASKFLICSAAMSPAAKPPRPRAYEPPSGTPTASYEWTKSTTTNYRSVDMDFHGPYARSRARVDYMYHVNYFRRRQKVQDDIVYGILNNRPKDVVFKERPWLVFTAGAMGSGKNYVLDELGRLNHFPRSCFVTIDPDEIKDKLPEIEGYRSKDAVRAYTHTHGEAGFIAELAQLECLDRNYNILIHGSLRNHQWYSKYLDKLDAEYPHYRRAIIYVVASAELVRRRALSRASISGRSVPCDRVENSLEQVPKSVAILRPRVGPCFTVENNEKGLNLKEPEGWSWAQFAAVFDPNSESECC